ncbi:MAG: tetratricopeptide repeat protein [bacterium]|nr:tetratricopeptide repeat protein [bacterium]
MFNKLKNKKILLAGTISIIAIAALIYFSISEHYKADNMIKAKQYFKSGNTEKAAVALNNIIKNDSSNVEAYKLLAEIYNKRGNYLEAAKLWGSVKRLDPFNKEALEMQAGNLFLIDAYPAIIEILKSVYDKNECSDNEKIYLAKAYTGIGKLKEAEKIISKLLKIDNKNQEALLVKGNIEFKRKNITDALKIFKGIDSNNSSISAAKFIGLANCYEYNNKTQKAERYYIKANEILKNNYQIEMILADFYNKNNNYNKAIDILTSLRQKYPSSIEVIIRLADLYTLTNNIKAIHSLKNSIKKKGLIYIQLNYYIDGLIEFLRSNYSDSLKYFNWAGKKFKKGKIYSLCTLYSYTKQRDTASTLKTVNIFLRRNTPPDYNRVIISFLLFEAERAFKSNNVDFTLKISKRIIQYDPNNIPAHILLMWCYFVDGRVNEALIETSVILNKDKLDISALEVKGRIYLLKDEYTAAESFFNKITKKYPERVVGYYWSGISAMRQKKYKDGLKQLNIALELNPSNTQTINAIYNLSLTSSNYKILNELSEKLQNDKDNKLQALGYLYMAEYEKIHNNLKSALKFYNLAINKNPEYIPYYLYLAKTLRKLKKYTEASKVLTKALRIAPKNKYAIFELAYLYYEAGELNKSITTYTKLIKLHPDWALPLANLSSAMAEKNKHNPKALLYAKKAAMLSPNTWFIRLNLGKIYFDRKEYKNSLRELHEVLKLMPGNKEAEELVEKAEKFVK